VVYPATRQTAHEMMLIKSNTKLFLTRAAQAASWSPCPNGRVADGSVLAAKALAPRSMP
jgi:hypothetical protein